MKSCVLVLLFALTSLLVLVDISSAKRHLPTTAPIGNCGANYSDQVCPTGECCSQWGGCGFTAAYCAPPGCQPDYGECWNYSPPPPPPTPPPPPGIYGNCGANYSYQVCPNHECCSKWGGCGFTSAYCGVGCQPDYGVCWAPPPSSTPAPQSADGVVVDLFPGDSHSLIRKVFDGLGLLNPF